MLIRSWILLGLLCTFGASTAAARDIRRPVDASSTGEIQALPSFPSTVYPYYQTLKTFSFDTAGNPDAQGWTTHDLTAQDGLFWHVDDFAGLSGYAPLSGTKSMWCGVRPGTLTDPLVVNAPGYGDHWTQILQSSTFNTGGQSRPVRLTARMRFDFSDIWDALTVEYRAGSSGSWALLGSYSETGATSDFLWQAQSGPQGAIEFRFVMSSDYDGSDESNFNSNGAVVIDDIILSDGATFFPYYVDNFESAAVGSNNGTWWSAATPAPFGNYAGILSGSGVAQTGPADLTGIWSFFNGSTATYSCGGYPQQPAVPYTQVPGSTLPSDYLYNEVRSPLIDISVDANNQPADPNMRSLAAEFDRYADLPVSTNGVLYGYRWRFVVSGVLRSWQSLQFFYAVSPWARATTLSTGGVPIPAGATHVQFSLVALDYVYGLNSVGNCHSQSPLFDNVSIIRMYSPVRVTNTNDAGVGSLRQAIINANVNPDFSAMVFLLPGDGPHTINLTSPLPAVTQPLWIDGFSQAGALPNTLNQGAATNAVLKIAINGTSAGANANGLWFVPGGYGVVRGLAIGGFSSAGIRYESTSLIVTGCYIGTDATGTTVAPNMTGIAVVTQGMDIGGGLNEDRMLISANSYDAIDVMAGGCHIFNARIGYDALGYEFANGDAIHVFGGTSCQIGTPAVNGCDGAHTDQIWIEIGNIAVEPAASGVTISQVRFQGGTIDLGNDGATANDPLDADTGANGLVNSPVLTSASGSTILGTMDGLPNQTHRVEFFSGDGYGGISKYLGYANVPTDGSGHGQIYFGCGPIPPASVITATATAGSNTSEFGPWITSMNTPPGAPSPLVLLFDDAGLFRGFVQFDAVTSGGNTTITPTTPANVPNPQSWNVGLSPLYWDISTTATFTGNVHVFLSYNPGEIPGPENTLRLLHYQNGSWVDVSDTFDFAGNRIGGTVTSLSPFVLAMPTGATPVGDLPAPDTFALRANVPNPFNPVTTIAYDIPGGGADVTIAIFDVSGRQVRTLVNEHRAAGRYTAQWNGEDDRGGRAASGVYFYRMSAGAFVETRKMVLLK